MCACVHVFLMTFSKFLFSLIKWYASFKTMDTPLRKTLLSSYTCCVLSCSVVWDSVTWWTAARQAPLSMGILQVRILEWVAYPFFRGSFQCRNQTGSPALQADSLPAEPPGKPVTLLYVGAALKCSAWQQKWLDKQFFKNRVRNSGQDIRVGRPSTHLLPGTAKL